MDKIEYWRNCYDQEFKIVNGKLQLDNLQLYNLNIKGYLDLEGCTSLVSLPDNIKVARYLNLTGCTSLKSLPDNLAVGGYLNLTGCTSLKSLPDNLAVGGFIDLKGCTSLVSLPDNLTVEGHLDLEGCTSLVSLPDNIKVARYLDLKGCTSLVSLPDNLTVDGCLNLDGCTSLKHIGKNNLFKNVCFHEYLISQEPRYSYIHIFQDIPESLKQSFIGKRVIDLIDDTRIYGTRYAEAIITGLDDDGDFVIELKG